VPLPEGAEGNSETESDREAEPLPAVEGLEAQGALQHLFDFPPVGSESDRHYHSHRVAGAFCVLPFVWRGWRCVTESEDGCSLHPSDSAYHFT
jgi:hypothetical protein